MTEKIHVGELDGISSDAVCTRRTTRRDEEDVVFVLVGAAIGAFIPSPTLDRLVGDLVRNTRTRTGA